MVTPKDIAKQEARRLTFVARDVRQRAESILDSRLRSGTRITILGANDFDELRGADDAAHFLTTAICAKAGYTNLSFGVSPSVNLTMDCAIAEVASALEHFYDDEKSGHLKPDNHTRC